MEELIRDTMHEALDVEPVPAGFRQRVIAAVPMHDRGVPRHRGRPFGWTAQWAIGLVAALLAAAVIASLIYSRDAVVSHVGPQNPSLPRLISPEGIAIAPDGTVYVSDYVANRIFKLRGGRLTSIAGGGSGGDGPATQASLFHPVGVALDREGNVYFADGLGSTIRRIDRQGNISTIARLTAPLGLAFDGAGDLYVGQRYGAIKRIDANGVTAAIDTSSVPPPATDLAYLAFDSAGNLYITDRAPDTGSMYPDPNGGCRIVRLNHDQKFSVIAGTGTCGYSGDGGPATAAQLNDPNGIAFDSAGNLYFADANNHRIRRIDKNGIITTVAGSGGSGFSGDGGPATRAQLAYPFGIGMAPGNLLYISDAACSCVDPIARGHIRVLQISTGLITTIAGG